MTNDKVMPRNIHTLGCGYSRKKFSQLYRSAVKNVPEKYNYVSGTHPPRHLACGTKSLHYQS